jgi:hypothetical protein
MDIINKLRNTALSILFLFGLSGCVSFPLMEKDLKPIQISGNLAGNANVKLVTGNVVHGSAPVMLSVGSALVPGPSKGNPGWGYSQNDQEVFARFLKTELERNNIFKSVSYQSHQHTDFTVKITFNNTVQQSDWAVYYLDVTLQVLKNNSELFHRSYKFQANDKTEEFWKEDSWSGAKARASNRLAAKIVADFQKWLTQQR